MLFLGDMLVEKEFNVLTHELVPEHIIMNEEEKKQLLEKFNITINQLPKILKNDPAAKQIEAKEGDIIKIVRRSQTAGEAIYYRLVVKK